MAGESLSLKRVQRGWAASPEGATGQCGERNMRGDPSPASVRSGLTSSEYHANVSGVLPGKINVQMTVAILAGGQSRRMGTDKARLEVDGTPLLERVARAALAADFSVLVVGRARPDDWPLEGVAFTPDIGPGRGPLGGLETALRLTQSPILALACDLPILTGTALRWLANCADDHGGPHGLAVRNGEQWEPLFSVYAPVCLPLIEERLAKGRLSLHALFESGDFGTIDAPDWVAAQLVNANTPEEWARIFTPF